MTSPYCTFATVSAPTAPMATTPNTSGRREMDGFARPSGGHPPAVSPDAATVATIPVRGGAASDFPCDHRDWQAGDIAGCPTCVATARSTAPAPRARTAYRCADCGSSHPARGARQKHRGGPGCRTCQANSRALLKVWQTAYEEAMADAPRDDFGARKVHRERAFVAAAAKRSEAGQAMGLTEVFYPARAAELVGGAA